MKKNISQSGFTILELVIGSAIIAGFLLAATYSFQIFLRLSRENNNSLRATFLLEEGLEAARIWRDTSWSDISGLVTVEDNPAQVYYYNFTGANWATTPTNTFIDGLFERKLQVANAYRNGSNELVSSGGTEDHNTRLLTVSVAWKTSAGTTTRSLSTYLANLFNN